MKMMLPFMTDFCLGVVNLKNKKHLKKDKRKTNAHSAAS